MNGPQQTACFAKAILNYTFSLWPVHLSYCVIVWRPNQYTNEQYTSSKAINVSCRTTDKTWTIERANKRTDIELAVLGFARLWTAFAKQQKQCTVSHLVCICINIGLVTGINWKPFSLLYCSWGNAWEIQAKSGICGNLFVMFSIKFHVKLCNEYSEACYARLAFWAPTTGYYLKFFEKHDIEVSIAAWFSHAMPLMLFKKTPSR